MSSQITPTMVLALVPELLLLILAVAVIFYDRALKPTERRRLGVFTGWGVLVVLLVTFGLWLLGEPGTEPAILWGGMIRHDLITLVFTVMFLIAALITSLIAVDTEELQHGEFYALLLMSTIGFILMAASGDMIMLYLALETASIPLYLLAGFGKKTTRSAEAGMKYFVYGAFASAIMLYGLSFLYGLTNETNLILVARSIVAQPEGPVLLASIMVIVGFGFKISAVPFHFWTPDVYEGAPSAVTGLVSTASKAAGFAVFLRVLMAGVFGTVEASQEWWAMLVAMAIVTMTLGNILAIWQTNLKRMLAYSSIAQAGYTLIGLVTLSVEGTGAAMFYLLYYVFTNIAAFGVIILLSNIDKSDEISDLNGLNRRSPWLALAMMFALLSLGGIPPTAGFFGKFFIFKAAVDSGLWWLALIGILNAFVALYYYLNVIKAMYLYRSDEEAVVVPVSRAAKVGLAVAMFGIFYLAFLAGPVFEWTRDAAAMFFVG